jgi:hypothetical protein
MPTYTDPNLDFGLEQELLIKALKESEAQRAARIQGAGLSPQGRFDLTAESSPGGQLAAGLDRIVGNITKPQVEQNMRDLRGEETRRYDELTRQINEPQTKTVKVLKRALGEDLSEGPSVQTVQEEQQVPLDYSNPDDLMAMNTRRMEIAGQMSKLPMAQKMAQTYLDKGAAFPETVAKMRMDQIERGQQAAQKALDAKERQQAQIDNQKWMAQLSADTRMTLGQMAAAAKASGKSESAVNQDAADFIAGRFLEGDKSALIGISRNKELHAAVMASIARQANDPNNPVSPKEAVQRGLEYTGASAEQRTMGTQSANVAMAAQEANKMIDIATNLSKSVPRSEFPTLNAAGNVINKNTGDPNITAFNQSIDSLINGYARAINPRGVATVADKKRAHDTLSAAFSSGQFDATTKVMRQEMEAALAAPQSARASARESRVGGGGKEAPKTINFNDLK